MKKVIVFLLAVLLLTGCAETKEEKRGRIETDKAELYAEGYENGYSDGYAGDPANTPAGTAAYRDGYADGYSDGVFISEKENAPGAGLVWQSTPNSSCFSWVAYDSGDEKLAVIFRSNETRAYVYSDFSQSDWDTFISASSLGSYYNTHIKGKYDCERYDDADAFRKNGT